MYFAFDVNFAVVLFDDAEDSRQSQAGSATHFFGGKERFKGAGLNGLGHAGSGVGNGEEDVLARFGVGVGGGEFLAEQDVGGFNGQPPAVGHGVAGVNSQVDDDLFELGRVHFYGPQGRCQAGVQFDVFADDAPQHLAHGGDDGVAVEHFGLDDLFAKRERVLISNGVFGEILGSFENFQYWKNANNKQMRDCKEGRMDDDVGEIEKRLRL